MHSGEAGEGEIACKPLSVVAIGASAGGLVAFKRLLRKLPPDTGMAFVLVQHLHPRHQSSLAPILARNSSMPVQQVADGDKVLPNHVYVIPPNRDMTISQGVLKLRSRFQGEWIQNRTIDIFFESLALDQHDRAIGVILSGMASDGTVGMEAIKREGGLCFAQNGSASCHSMPCSVIKSGGADYVLAPEEMAETLSALSKGASARHSSRQNGSQDLERVTGQRGLSKLLRLLSGYSGIDFSVYRPNTVRRVIERRMALSKFERLDAYTGFLADKPHELEALSRELLPHETGFFRDSPAFEALRQKVIPQLHSLQDEHSLRIWTVGCSSGQEACSIALLLAKFGAETNPRRNFKLFATDINPALIQKARASLYPQSIGDEVPEELLRQFFVPAPGGYRLAGPLREQIVFAQHDLLQDPPYGHLDLITCRNLLVYLRPEAQRQALAALHYALEPHGFLFLGEFDIIGSQSALFQTVDAKHRIYKKSGGAASSEVRATM